MAYMVAAVAPELTGVHESCDLPYPAEGKLQRILEAFNDRHRYVYNTLADEYDRKSKAHIATTRDRVAYVADYIEPGSRVLDVGCGVGLALMMLGEHEKGLHPTGVDVSPRMVELARLRNPQKNVIPGDFLTTDLGAQYDAIWEQAVFHLFPRVAEGRVFARFRALLNPGGILSLSTTVSAVSREGWENKRDYGPAPQRYRRSITESELIRTLDRHSFELLDKWFTTDPFGKKWFTVVGKKY